MKPYQVYLFSEKGKALEFLPTEPVFVFENKRYLNFSNFNCLNLQNNDYLRETAKLNIDARGIAIHDGHFEIFDELKKSMTEIKKIDALLLSPNEISVFVAVFSIFEPKATFFIDYETSPSITTVLQHRNVEYYTHRDLDQLKKLLSAKSERVIIIDGLYEWLGYIGPVNNLIEISKQYECFIIANEINSFGLLGRDGRGFIDLFNLYDGSVNIEIGGFGKFLGGFGYYIGAKRYLINKIEENVEDIIEPLPQFMVAVNLAGLQFLKDERHNKSLYQKLWSKSRYFITRLKQVGFKTDSDTPIIIIRLNNNEEALRLTKRLFDEGIVAEQRKERLRFALSIGHTKEDLDICLDKLANLTQELGIR